MIKHSTKPPAGKIQSIAFAIGVDVGDRFSRVCILDSDGVPCKEERVRTSEVGFRQYFERLAPSQIALEAGTHSGWVSRLLPTCGHIAIVANARELRKIHQSDRKNDRADAEILARMLRFVPNCSVQSATVALRCKRTSL